MHKDVSMTDIFMRSDAASGDVITYAKIGGQLVVTIAFSRCDILRSPERLLTLAAAAVNGTVTEACASLFGTMQQHDKPTPLETDRALSKYFGGVESGYLGS